MKEDTRRKVVTGSSPRGERESTSEIINLVKGEDSLWEKIKKEKGKRGGASKEGVGDTLGKPRHAQGGAKVGGEGR